MDAVVHPPVPVQRAHLELLPAQLLRLELLRGPRLAQVRPGVRAAALLGLLDPLLLEPRVQRFELVVDERGAGVVRAALVGLARAGAAAAARRTRTRTRARARARPGSYAHEGPGCVLPRECLLAGRCLLRLRGRVGDHGVGGRGRGALILARGSAAAVTAGAAAAVGVDVRGGGGVTGVEVGDVLAGEAETAVEQAAGNVGAEARPEPADALPDLDTYPRQTLRRHRAEDPLLRVGERLRLE